MEFEWCFDKNRMYVKILKELRAGTQKFSRSPWVEFEWCFDKNRMYVKILKELRAGTQKFSRSPADHKVCGTQD